MFNKKGIISLNLFVLLLLLFLVLLGFSYFYKDFSQKEHIEDVSLLEITHTGTSLRSFFVETVVYENQTSTYEFPYDNEEIIAQLNNSEIVVSKELEANKIEEVFSLYGIKFCSSYEISPVQQNQFQFNGTCILKQ